MEERKFTKLILRFLKSIQEQRILDALNSVRKEFIGGTLVVVIHIANGLSSSKIAFVGIPTSLFKMTPEDLDAVIGKITLKAWGEIC